VKIAANWTSHGKLKLNGSLDLDLFLVVRTTRSIGQLIWSRKVSCQGHQTLHEVQIPQR